MYTTNKEEYYIVSISRACRRRNFRGTLEECRRIAENHAHKMQDYCGRQGLTFKPFRYSYEICGSSGKRYRSMTH